MKILVIHQYFLDQAGGGGSRWNQFAKYFAEAGHKVTVLAGMLEPVKAIKPLKYKGKFIVKESGGDGITVCRCHVSESYNRSFLGRAWAYISFLLSSMLAGLFRVSRPDIIIATSPPLTVAPAMWYLARWHKVPAVFEVRDLWPESAIDTGVLTGKRMIAALYRLEAKAYRRAAFINVLTPAFVEALVTKKGVPREKISMIPNGADLDIMQPGPKENEVRRRFGLQGKFVVSYFGAHGRANRLGQLLDVAEKLKEQSYSDIRMLLVGDGMEKAMLVDEALRRGLNNIIFVDVVAKAEVCQYINASDVCTAVLMKNETFKTVYPNKVFDYMACKRPTIVAIDGVARELVEAAEAGLYCEPENPDAFVAALIALKNAPDRMKQMGENAYNHVVENYSRKSMSEVYLKVLESVVAAHRRKRS